MSGNSEPRVGETFAGYRIEDQAGRGGMGVVYRATHLRLERTVALKLIAPALAQDPAFVSRFEREWRLMAALEHPNVIGIYEAGEVEGVLYLAMRWVPGGDLAQRLRGTAGLEPRVATEVLGQVAAALDAAHQRGVVHRDVKPANILLDGDHAWLTDFGAGKDLTGGDPRTSPGRWVGTADYVAPELLDGLDPTPAADIYSLGCVLFETLTGRVPFPRDTEVATLWAHRYEPPPSTTEERPGLPAALDDVLRRMLAKDPAERPASAGEALRAARAAATTPPPGRPTVIGGAAPSAAAPASGGDAPPEAARRRRLGLAAGAAVGVIAAVVIAVLALQPDDDARPGGGASAARTATATPSAADTATPTATRESPSRTTVWRIPLGPNSIPGNVVAGEEQAVIADEGLEQLIVLDGRNHALKHRLDTDGVSPRDVALSEDGSILWASSDSTTLRKEILEQITHDTRRVGVKALYLAVRGEDVFVMARDPGGPLQRISAGTGGDGAPLEIPGTPADLEATADGVFALTSDPPRLHRIAPDGTHVVGSVDVDVDGVPDEVVLTGDDGWLTDPENHRVVRFDATNGDVRDTFEIDGEPDGIATDGRVVFVVVREGRVERFDAATAERLTPIDAKGRLGADIDVGPDGVLWISGDDGDVVQIELDQD